jgi:phosphatidylserine/phosphatidylglycerophosphate/cardiolipin synthase-like enzyme
MTETRHQSYRVVFGLLLLGSLAAAPASAAEEFADVKEIRLIQSNPGGSTPKTVIIRDKAKIEQFVGAIQLEKKAHTVCDHIDRAVFVKDKGEIAVSLCDRCFDIGKNSYKMPPAFYQLYTACVSEAATTKPHSAIEICFSPNGGCTETILKEIRAAKDTVLVQAYWFTSAPIAKALVEAHKRGVKVEAVLDLSRAEIDNGQADVLVEGGVPTFLDDKHVTAHNKVIIVDGRVVITGSFNFTEQAETSNAENLMVIRDKAVADTFIANWKLHRGHSGRYGRPPDHRK